jgi:hypothetical protein
VVKNIKQNNMRSNIAKHYADRNYNSPLKQMPVNNSPRVQYDVDGSSRIMSGNKDITNTPEGKRVISKKKTDALYAAQDESRKNRGALSIADISGVSNWGDAKRGAQSLYGMATDPNVKFNAKRATQDALDIVSAVPVYGRVKTAAEAFKIAKVGVPAVSSQIAKIVTKGVGANAFTDITSKIVNQSEEKEKNKVSNTNKVSNNKYFPSVGVSIGAIKKKK